MSPPVRLLKTVRLLDTLEYDGIESRFEAQNICFNLK